MNLSDKFLELSDKAISGELTEEEVSEFNTLLEQSSEYRESFKDRLSMESDLLYHLGDISHINSWQSILESRENASKNKSKIVEIRQPHHQIKKESKHIYKMAMIGVAACLCIATFLGIWFDHQKIKNEKLVKVTLSGNFLYDKDSLSEGTNYLSPGTMLDGEGVLTLSDKSTISLLGKLSVPDQFGSNHWKLHSGKAQFVIQPRDQTQAIFEVDCGHGEVKVLGTQFTINQLDTFSTVFVKEGVVEISDARGDRQLTSGQHDRISNQPWQVYALVGPLAKHSPIPVQNNSTIKLSETPNQQINFVVDAPTSVTSMQFKLNKPIRVFQYMSEYTDSILEEFPPFTLFRSHTGNIDFIKPDVITDGLYEVEASGLNQSKEVVEKFSFTFTLEK